MEASWLSEGGGVTAPAFPLRPRAAQRARLPHRLQNDLPLFTIKLKFLPQKKPGSDLGVESVYSKPASAMIQWKEWRGPSILHSAKASGTARFNFTAILFHRH
ncbi:MAG: hypothetical protein IIC13_18235 [SAR324 cluster bacterium]|nr:hypothetical protein [SAR324 cluster bacterium]